MATPRVKNTGVVSPQAAAVPAAEPQPAVKEMLASQPGGAEPFRILAIDGGPAALLVVLMLTELEELVPGFLEKVDLIAGTSAGSITGLMLATRQNPAYMLPVAENFWLNEQLYYKNSLPGYLKALVGLGAVNDPQYTQQFLEQRGVLGNRKLSDLAKKVVATSLDLDPVRRAPGMRGVLNWQPKFFHNLYPHGTDLDLKAVDVVLSSSASPITTPVHQGKVDGGLVANNPAMVAISEVLRAGARHPEAAVTLPKTPHDIVMLSIGGGRAHEMFEVTNANWGYGRWLLDPSNPLLLLNAFLTGSSEGVTCTAAEILGQTRFFRLDPYYTDTGLLPFVQAAPRKQQATAAAEGTQALVRSAAGWLHRSGWMGARGAAAGAVA
jgi:predicted acylesterase/phospholipase RssA